MSWCNRPPRAGIPDAGPVGVTHRLPPLARPGHEPDTVPHPHPPAPGDRAGSAAAQTVRAQPVAASTSRVSVPAWSPPFRTRNEWSRARHGVHVVRPGAAGNSAGAPNASRSPCRTSTGSPAALGASSRAPARAGPGGCSGKASASTPAAPTCDRGPAARRGRPPTGRRRRAAPAARQRGEHGCPGAVQRGGRRGDPPPGDPQGCSTRTTVMPAGGSPRPARRGRGRSMPPPAPCPSTSVPRGCAAAAVWTRASPTGVARTETSGARSEELARVGPPSPGTAPRAGAGRRAAGPLLRTLLTSVETGNAVSRPGAAGHEQAAQLVGVVVRRVEPLGVAGSARPAAACGRGCGRGRRWPTWSAPCTVQSQGSVSAVGADGSRHSS